MGDFIIENNTDSSILNISSMDPDDIYKSVLHHIYDMIGENLNLNGRSLPRPDVRYDISRKTFWTNFKLNCDIINRDMKQVQKFFDKEFTVESSINQKNELIIKGRYNLQMILSTYSKYIRTFVCCSSCNSFDTIIERNKEMRINYLKCQNKVCGTSKAIKSSKK
jgi:translation initiation factor 2 subunit 2